jgi:hypothetical protein
MHRLSNTKTGRRSLLCARMLRRKHQIFAKSTAQIKIHICSAAHPTVEERQRASQLAMTVSLNSRVCSVGFSAGQASGILTCSWRRYTEHGAEEQMKLRAD